MIIDGIVIASQDCLILQVLWLRIMLSKFDQ